MHIYDFTKSILQEERLFEYFFEYYLGENNEKTVIYFKTENDMNLFTLPSLYKK